MKAKHFFTFLALTFTGFAGAQSAQPFSLEDAISYALANHPEIRLEELNIADADKQVKEYIATGVPKLQATGGYQYFFDIPTQILPDFLTPTVYNILIDENLVPDQMIDLGPGLPAQFGTKNVVQGGIELSALIFDGSFIVGLQAQKMYKELARRQLNVKSHELRNRITQAYLAVLVAERNIELLDKNLNNLDHLLTETKATYEAGFAEKLDVDRLQLSLDQLRTDRENIARLLDVSYNLLKFQMGYPLDAPIELSEDFDALTGREWADEMIDGEEIKPELRPEMAVIELGEKLNEMNIKRIKASYLPTLTGFASHSQTLQRNDLFDKNDNPWFPNTVAGVNLSVPIFDGLDRSAKMQRARISLDKVRLEKDQFVRAVTLEVRNARVKMQNAYETVNARRRSLELAEEIYRVTQVKFREGVGSSLELTQAEADLYESQRQYIQALYELVIARAELDYALGNPGL